MVYILKKSNIIIENGIKEEIKQGSSMQTCDRYNECGVVKKV